MVVIVESSYTDRYMCVFTEYMIYRRYQHLESHQRTAFASFTYGDHNWGVVDYYLLHGPIHLHSRRYHLRQIRQQGLNLAPVNARLQSENSTKIIMPD